MSDNNEKDKDIRDLPIGVQGPEELLNDLNELLEWVANPRIYWDNFKVTLPIKKPNDIKWVQTRVEEA